MPWGRYPDRVKPFRKWAQEKTDKAQITDSATGSNRRRSRMLRRKRRSSRKKKKED